MIWLELFCVLLALYIGSRLGGVAIGFAGGLGVAVLTLGFDLPAGTVPVDVILIIMSVIAAISAMQLAGGMDWLVSLARLYNKLKPVLPIIKWGMIILVISYLAKWFGFL